MKGYDFVLICNPTWELKIGSNIRNIATELAKNNRVLYVNPPLDRKTILTGKKDPDIQKKIKILKGDEKDLTELDKNLWLLEPRMVAESVNWIPFTALFKFFNRRNSIKYAKKIKEALKELNFINPIILNDSLMFRGYDLKELIQPRLYCYYIRDYLVSQPYFKKHGATMEPELMVKSDIVFANSVFLKNHAAQYNTNSHYIGQGYENKNFNIKESYSIPKDLEEIKKPTIGYVGTLTALRLDEEMMLYGAKQLPNYSFVFVGPTDQVFEKSDLHKMSNVHFLGLKPMKELASYVKNFNVCINPQLINDLTIGNYPLKIDEYLSLGKPVIATKTEAMESFKEFTYLAKDKSEYVDFIKRAIEENNKEKELKRVAFASEHTWENCINQIYQEIKKMLNQ